jgi:hypothetical protein
MKNHDVVVVYTDRQDKNAKRGEILSKLDAKTILVDSKSRITLDNMQRIYFMDEAAFNEWKKSNTYILYNDGKTYKNGVEINEEN